MDAFGDDYVVHNLPLLLLSGLEGRQHARSDASPTAASPLHEGGFRVKTDLPTLDSPDATRLRDTFLAHDGSQAVWKAQSPSSTQAKGFKIRNIGRVGQAPIHRHALTLADLKVQVFTFPPRKAPPPPHSPRLAAVAGSDGPPPPLVLHSPLSPLTPSSPLFPDGVMTRFWLAKHQDQLPSALLAFFTLTGDQNTSSLLDNKIKSETNNLRSVLASTNYKTRLVVILLADRPIDLADIEDRLTMIRKSANLDLKSLYFQPYNASQVETTEFVRSILASLYPLCIEYYRDLSKHARRKRNRSTTPQPTVAPVTAHLLPSLGWNVRYEFKLGVFAEFRQEMDAACRNYESAYENLFLPEMIDTIHAWSPRFNEARLLADVLAIRILRCLLWTGRTTSAVRTWVAHRDRVSDLVDRRGKGTETYAWEAWQSLWSKTMAELISRSDQASLGVKLAQSPDILSTFAGPEKSMAVGERATPWEMLQHEGYWLQMALRSTLARRERALEMPVEDRQPPGQSPASMIASKAQTYDTYMALEPHAELSADGKSGFDYKTEVETAIDNAIAHFAKRKQQRMIEAITLEQAVDHIRDESWSEALQALLPLWSSHHFRESGWWSILQHVGQTLLDCAVKSQDFGLLAQLRWELDNSVLDLISNDGSSALVPSNIELPATSLSLNEVTSQLSASFAFASISGNVGQPLDCQLSLRCCSNENSEPLSLSEIKIAFEGALKPVYITATDDKASGVPLEAVNVQLEDASRLSTSVKRSSAGAIAAMVGEANFELARGQTRIFNMQVLPREAGEVVVASITMMVRTELGQMTLTASEHNNAANEWWETRHALPLRRPVGPERDVTRVEILRKPPKVELSATNFSKTYYTNEDVELHLDISNNEDEVVSLAVGARLISPVRGAATFGWLDQASTANSADEEELVQILERREIAEQQPGSTTRFSLLISETVAALDHELEVTVSYRLQSDPDSVLEKTLVLDVVVIRPFEANYDFLPRLLREAWPSFFSMPENAAMSSMPLGLKQQYLVTAGLFSFASEPIIIEAILLTTSRITGGAIATSSTGILKDAPTSTTEAAISAEIQPETTRSFDFDLSVQKHILGDRHTVALDLFLQIGWRRPNSGKVNTSILEVPQFAIPMAEPRVLLTVEAPKAISSTMSSYTLIYTLENPSMHFLTFNISMESNEHFAFSGPKASAISLVPVSRHEVRYKILPNKHGQWVKVGLGVVDAYFNQTLRVQAAGEGVKGDKKGGVLVWVD